MNAPSTACPVCEGKGYVACDMCNGEGTIFKEWRANPDGSENDIEVRDDCPRCLNDSDRMHPDCPECRGTGKVEPGRPGIEVGMRRDLEPPPPTGGSSPSLS